MTALEAAKIRPLDIIRESSTPMQYIVAEIHPDTDEVTLVHENSGDSYRFPVSRFLKSCYTLIKTYGVAPKYFA